MTTLTTCHRCAKHENHLASHLAELKRLAYLAQSKMPSRALKAQGEIPKVKEIIKVARANLAEHLEHCEATERRGMIP